VKNKNMLNYMNPPF